MQSVSLTSARPWICSLVSIAALLASPTGAAAVPASQSAVPRLFSTIAERGGDYVDVFKVRPRRVGFACGDGGTLVLSWRSWTASHATGKGRLSPCRGTSRPRFTVRASRPVDGYFTRLTLRYRSGNVAHMALANMGGSTMWLTVSWMYDPDSGASPWPS